MSKFFTLRLAGLAVVAASALAISAPAFAQSPTDQSVRIHVSYRDLDIDHAKGAAVLKSRIEAAAVEACGGDETDRDLGRMALLNQCRVKAVDAAMSKLGPTQLADARLTSSR